MNWNGLTFDTSNAEVYPPKPASLLLAEQAIKVIQPGDRVLDACTGCGVVAITIAKYVQHTDVFVSDLNPAAIATTIQNAKQNNLKITAIITDLYQSFSDNYFDVITVHPPAIPYPPKKDWGMTVGMGIATNGGDDGSVLVSRSIIEAKRCLKTHGKLLLLLPHWSNVQKAWSVLRENYTEVAELVNKQVEFFPMVEGLPSADAIQYAHDLVDKGIIELNFNNGIATSTVSVILATKI